MQQFDIYLRAASVKGTLVDASNNAISTKCSLTCGMAAELVLHLFHSASESDTFTAAELAYSSWVFYADVDYDHTTTPKLLVNSGITVDTDGYIHIPIENTSTTEMISYLGTAESKDLKIELVGFNAGSTLPDFCLQSEISIRNRIGVEGGGQPVPVADSNYTAAQVNALFAASNTVEYSSDGETWTSAYSAGATQRRYKNSGISGAVWTSEYLAAGPSGADGSNGSNGSNGSDGKTYYAYDGYAADSSGTDFSITPSDSRKYKAEFHSTEVITSLAYSHFTSAGAVWVRYIGSDGNGDMLKEDYVNAGGTGVVLKASSALSVPYSGIQSLPSSFPPASHSHAMQDIADGARQTVYSGASASELYLNRHVIQNETAISAGVLNIDFTAVKDSSGGTAYSASAGDVLTWEYWVKATDEIASISVGSSLTLRVLEDHELPETLPMKGSGSTTLHVFAVRGFYKSGATQNLQLTINYLYSTEA